MVGASEAERARLIAIWGFGCIFVSYGNVGRVWLSSMPCIDNVVISWLLAVNLIRVCLCEVSA